VISSLRRLGFGHAVKACLDLQRTHRGEKNGSVSASLAGHHPDVPRGFWRGFYVWVKPPDRETVPGVFLHQPPP